MNKKKTLLGDWPHVVLLDVSIDAWHHSSDAVVRPSWLNSYLVIVIYILSDKHSDSFCDILSDVLFGILSDSLSGILSDILSGILTFAVYGLIPLFMGISAIFHHYSPMKSLFHGHILEFSHCLVWTTHWLNLNMLMVESNHIKSPKLVGTKSHLTPIISNIH